MISGKHGKEKGMGTPRTEVGVGLRRAIHFWWREIFMIELTLEWEMRDG